MIKIAEEFYRRMDEETKGTDRHFHLLEPSTCLMHLANETAEVRDAWMYANNPEPRNNKKSTVPEELGDCGMMVLSFIIQTQHKKIELIRDELTDDYVDGAEVDTKFVNEIACYGNTIPVADDYGDYDIVLYATGLVWTMVNAALGDDMPVVIMARMAQIANKNGAYQTYNWLTQKIGEAYARTHR